jgi:hypothetical protein
MKHVHVLNKGVGVHLGVYISDTQGAPSCHSSQNNV